MRSTARWYKKQLEPDVSTVYSSIDSLSNKVITLPLTDAVDLRTILNNIQKVIPKYLSLASDPKTNI